MSELLIERQDGVCTLTLNRPDKLNAFTGALSSQLIQALEAASQDDEVRAIVITGAGRGFCSGLDLTGVAELTSVEKSRHDRLDPLEWVGRLTLAIVKNISRSSPPSTERLLVRAWQWRSHATSA